MVCFFHLLLLKVIICLLHVKMNTQCKYRVKSLIKTFVGLLDFAYRIKHCFRLRRDLTKPNYKTKDSGRKREEDRPNETQQC